MNDALGYTWNLDDRSSASSSPLTLEQLKELHDDINHPPVIEVWHGDNPYMLPLPECPQFIESNMVDDETMYVLAGVGIVAGKRIQDLLWDEGVLAVWSSDPIDPTPKLIKK